MSEERIEVELLKRILFMQEAFAAQAEIRSDAALVLSERQLIELRRIRHELQPPTPTSITFHEVTMNPTEAGQTQVFTGTLAPAGSSFPSDAAYTIASNDPAVSPTVDSTGLIVSVTYPAGWVESTTTPLEFTYGASSVSNPTWTLAGTITPSAPPQVLPTSISFVQTT